MTDFLLFFLLQFVSYVNLTIDIRAVNHEQYLVAGLTNIAAPLIAWVMIKKVSKATSYWGLLAVALGGATATWTGMWLTRMWQ